MQEHILDSSDEASDAEDMYTDTSMFNAEEIVRQIEITAAAKKAALLDNRINARRRAEMLREQKMLEADLADLDDLDFES